MVRKIIVVASLVFALALSALAVPREPSTPSERKKALDIIDRLEQTPMNPALKQDREWVFQWMKEVPDVSVSICTEVVKPLQSQKNSPERNVLLLQNMLANARFSMLNPGKMANSVEGYMAGAEGMIRAYKNLVKADPSRKNTFMEALLVKEKQGTLQSYIQRSAAECSKHPVTTLTP